MPPITVPALLGYVYGRSQQLADLAAPILNSARSQPRDANPSLNSITARDTTYKYGQGSSPAASFNNAGYLALFAILGTAMVIASIWFFFWAKNGGFHWRETDWDDYKSTVLRRKGPDGRTLSNATKSTKLGGGSSIAGTQHHKWQKQLARSVVGYDEKGRKGVMAKRGFAGTHSITYSDDYMTETFGTKSVTDEMTEINTEYNGGATHSKRYKDRDMQDYKKEKPARVGGINRVADGSHFDTTNTDRSDAYTEASEEPMLPKAARDGGRERKDAERKAKEEAARMERRWKREAEAAAAALAREHDAPPPPAHRKSAVPSVKPGSSKPRRSESRSTSPKKRDFSYQIGPESEVLSTAYTGSTRTASYYDAYRPKHDGYSTDGERRTRQPSPKKTRGREGGYRRGADSDFD
ncbi:hypothetical protein AMS68_001603 [Peltaster fructicola]|uniref:Uncharacterized protein n=1 Tax=Peltaster fructicola TaxID=286661 RepID=A0A6H0XN05_9PEZI|nr:hypothetical protein AMS68_001603 [Peltaster fructicola]